MKTRILTGTAFLFLFVVAVFGQTAQLPPMKSTRVFGQQIVYYDVGSGPVLVLLHGLGSRASFDWGPVLLPLAKHHRVLAMDQIGFGASDKPVIDYRIQTWIDFLGEFLRQQKVEHFVLGGESLGGWIAALYTIQALHPTPAANAISPLPVPEKLILSDAGGHSHLAQNLPADLANNLVAGSLLLTKQLLSHVYYNKALVTDEVARQAFVTKLASGDGFTVRSIMTSPESKAESVDDRLGEITIPTLIFWGANDEFIPVDDGYDFQKKIPQAKLIVVPECGHAPEIEKPDAYLEGVRAFLGEPAK